MKPGRFLVFKSIFSSPFSLVLLATASIAYYYFIRYIIRISGSGLALVTAPIYLIYLTVVTSGLLLTISIYSLHLSLKSMASEVSEGAASVVTVFIGSLVSSCGCSAPILGTILYGIGFDSVGVSGILSFVGSNQYLLLGIISLANLLLIYYSLGKLSGECKLKNGRIVPRK